MPSKLSVHVQVDLDGRRTTVKVTAGTLTALSQQGLHALIRRARTLTADITVAVDLTGLARIDASGVRLLREALDDPGLTGRGGAVQLLLPPSSPALSSTGTVAA